MLKYSVQAGLVEFPDLEGPTSEFQTDDRDDAEMLFSFLLNQKVRPVLLMENVEYHNRLGPSWEPEVLRSAKNGIRRSC